MKFSNYLTRKLGLGIFGVVLIVGFGVVLARSGPLSPIRVTTQRVTSDSLAPSLFGLGSVEARRGYLLGPTVAGRVKAVYVDVGETVSAGQVLAELDPVDLEARQMSIEAAAARAASLASAAVAQQVDALARRDLAALNAQRYRELGSQQFVSASAVQGKQQELASAQAGVDAANANAQGAREELRRLKADQESLRLQRNNLRLLAPADGLVISRDAEPGSTVIAGQAVLRLVEPGSLWVKVRLDQARSQQLAVGLAAEIVLRSHPATPFPGKVARIEPLSDSVTEERIVQVDFEQRPEGLSIGEMAEVTVNAGASAAGLWVPNAAVKSLPQGSGVWKLVAGKPRLMPVKLGTSGLDGRVRVEAGLAENDEIIVYSERDLDEGSRIEVVNALTGKPR